MKKNILFSLLFTTVIISTFGTHAMQRSPFEVTSSKGMPLSNEPYITDYKTYDTLKKLNKSLFYNKEVDKAYHKSMDNEIKKINRIKIKHASSSGILNDFEIKKLGKLFCNDNIKIQQLGITVEYHNQDDSNSFYLNNVLLFRKININAIDITDYAAIKQIILNNPHEDIVFTYNQHIFQNQITTPINILAKNNAYVPEYNNAHALKPYIRTNETRVTFDHSTLNNLLFEAAKVDYISKDAILLLLQHGADINTVGDHNMTPLHYAALHGHTQTAQLLIEYGADIHAVDTDAMTPLHWASLNGHIEIVELFIDPNNIDTQLINMQNTNGMTPLITAAMNQRIDVAEYLIYNGANLNIQDNYDGNTALIWAVKNDVFEIAQTLIENEANITITDNTGKTAHNWALSNGYRDILNLFEDNSDSEDNSDMDINQISDSESDYSYTDSSDDISVQ